MMRRDAGYTLLEMLVALVVFGLVMAGIAQTFRFGLMAWPAATRNAAQPETMAGLDAALTRLVAQAEPGSMTGRPGQLAITTRLPPGSGVSGLADVAIMAAPGGLLVLRYSPHPPGIPFGPPPVPKLEPLAQGIDRLSFAYLVPQSGAAPAWSGSWSGDGLPLLVRIHIEFADGQNWPDLVAAPSDQAN